MSAQEEAAGVRLVSAEEARRWLPELMDDYAGSRAHRCVHTVVVQAEQIAAVLDLHSKLQWRSYCAHDGRPYPCPTARALGVTA